MDPDKIMVFGGSGSRRLVGRICEYLGVPVCAGEVLRFSEGNLFVRILENVRGRSVYLVQSTSFPANDNFMELLFWIDAFKRASAQSVTAVVPYFSYAKGDKKDEPRVSVRARVCADAIEAAGADRLVTMDLHAPQIQGFFKIPVDDLYALPAQTTSCFPWSYPPSCSRQPNRKNLPSFAPTCFRDGTADRPGFSDPTGAVSCLSSLFLLCSQSTFGSPGWRPARGSHPPLGAASGPASDT